MTKPTRLDSSNYGYWKVRMQAFISGLDEDCWSSIEAGWSPPVMLDDKKVEVLKPRDKWTAAEKKASSCNSKAKTAIYNAIDTSYFRFISQCASAQKAWKTLENMFEGTTSVKRTKLDMLASRFENLRMDEEETVAQFSAKLCDISNECFELGKQYKDKKLVKKLKRSLPSKFESKISAVEEAHNLDEMAFDEFVGILQAFELSKSNGENEKKKEDPHGIAYKSSSFGDPLAMLSRNYASYMKQRENKIKNGRRSDLGRSSSKVQCYECNGFRHVRKECANLLKQKKKDDKNDSDDDSNDGEKLKNFVEFTTFVTGSKTESATGSASASVLGSSCGGDDDAESEDDNGGSFDLAGNYEKLYEHWLKLVETNSDLAKEKAKLEAQVAEALKYVSEKEEEARQAGAQLAETQKNLRLLNNGTNQLDHLLSIGQSDRCGLGYQGECLKAEGVFVPAGKTKDVATSDTKPEVKRFVGNATYRKIAVKPATGVKNVTATRAATSTATATDTATAPERVSGLKNGSQQRFRPVCHHCGVVGHIRPRCFKLLREKNQMEQAYGMRYHGPICYSCGVQGHMRRDCVKSVQGANHGGFGLRNTWSRRFDHYGDGGMGFPPYFGGYGSSC